MKETSNISNVFHWRNHERMTCVKAPSWIKPKNTPDSMRFVLVGHKDFSVRCPVTKRLQKHLWRRSPQHLKHCKYYQKQTKMHETCVCGVHALLSAVHSDSLLLRELIVQLPHALLLPPPWLQNIHSAVLEPNTLQHRLVYTQMGCAPHL